MNRGNAERAAVDASVRLVETLSRDDAPDAPDDDVSFVVIDTGGVTYQVAPCGCALALSDIGARSESDYVPCREHDLELVSAEACGSVRWSDAEYVESDGANALSVSGRFANHRETGAWHRPNGRMINAAPGERTTRAAFNIRNVAPALVGADGAIDWHAADVMSTLASWPHTYIVVDVVGGVDVLAPRPLFLDMYRDARAEVTAAGVARIEADALAKRTAREAAEAARIAAQDARRARGRRRRTTAEIHAAQDANERVSAPIDPVAEALRMQRLADALASSSGSWAERVG